MSAVRAPVVVDLAADRDGVYRPRALRVPVRAPEVSSHNATGRIQRVKLGEGGFYVGAVFAPVAPKGA